MYIDIICLGIFFGVIAGLLPGVGMVTLTVLLLPVASHLFVATSPFVFVFVFVFVSFLFQIEY